MTIASTDPNLLGRQGTAPSPEFVSSDANSDIPKKHRVSARKLSEFLWQQKESGLSRRRSHSRAWQMVRSIMQENHYFSMRGGVLTPLAPDRTGRKVRAIAPIMKPKYRLELGRLIGNQIGVTAEPRLGGDGSRFYKSKRAAWIMEDWLTSTRVQDVFAEMGQHMAYYGGSALYRYEDKFHKTARVKSIPQPQIIPIPFDSSTLCEADGVMRIQIVTEGWLEAQDRKMEQLVAAGKADPAFRRMKKEAGPVSGRLTDDSIGLQGFSGGSGQLQGAVVINFWMKPTEETPAGVWGFMVGEKLFRYVSEFKEFEGKQFSLALPNGTPESPGKLPLEMAYYTKCPDDFYGFGPCESLIPGQRERNRSLSNLIRSLRQNKPIFGYDPQSVDPNDILDDDSLMVPIRNPLEGGRPPLWHFPASSVNRDINSVIGLTNQYTNEAVNHESPIISGQQSRRTEGFPATKLLDDNAQTPNQPVIDGISRAWSYTFPEILDMLKRLWPEEKVIRATGALNIGHELRLKRQDVPWSSEVNLTPNPMLSGGRQAMVQLLFALRNMRSDDGQGFELKSRELRRGLRALGINPPGIELISKKEQRIRDRIGVIINDGVKPGIQATAMQGGSPKLRMEDHKTKIEMLKEVILDMSFDFYSPEVQKALMDEIEFHSNMISPVAPDIFDDDIKMMDQLEGENDANTAEQDLSGFANQAQINGVPLGLNVG